MHSPKHIDMEYSCVLGWESPFGSPQNGDCIVIQHLNIMMDCPTPKHYLIIAQELP
jgi:hypothetical protein